MSHRVVEDEQRLNYLCVVDASAKFSLSPAQGKETSKLLIYKICGIFFLLTELKVPLLSVSSAPFQHRTYT